MLNKSNAGYLRTLISIHNVGTSGFINILRKVDLEDYEIILKRYFQVSST